MSTPYVQQLLDFMVGLLPKTKFGVGWGGRGILYSFNKSRTKWSCTRNLVRNRIQSKSHFLMYHVKPQRHICYHVLSLGNGYPCVLTL